ncbi:hypothetical protein [Streptomyces sp. CMB-StM0423]|uniref:hypothetical protein n=1 Tax=Streptomyces sp. CMB-StM0423 TaxID=2059884 RepID=UPI0026945571
MHLSRRLLALPPGLAATAAIGLPPGAAATGGTPGPAAAPGDPLSYVVNSATDATTLDRVETATAQVSGVAALLKRTHPRASPAELRALLAAHADDPGCPDTYDPDGDGTENAVCEGDARHNGFYGTGIADAFDAVRR